MKVTCENASVNNTSIVDVISHSAPVELFIVSIAVRLDFHEVIGLFGDVWREVAETLLLRGGKSQCACGEDVINQGDNTLNHILA